MQKQSFYLALPDERDCKKIENYDVKASPIQYGACFGPNKEIVMGGEGGGRK